jgi:hypothetical protein
VVDRCSLWQFSAAVDGWNKTHGGEPKPEPPTDAEFEIMLDQSAEIEARGLNGKQEPKRRAVPEANG